jgi:phenylpropionate dioxygenase-like ring-hydroxylating dioxygenase large terminal subunit
MRIWLWLYPALYYAFSQDPLSGKKQGYYPFYRNQYPVTKPQPVLQPTDTLEERELDRKYRQHWFVVEESKNIKVNTPYKSMIREKEYVFWKDSQNKFCAMDTYCNHRGADLSAGKIRRTRVVCPYHGAEFNRKGELYKIPGMEIEVENRSNLATCFHQDTYPILEINGWVYINTISKRIYESKEQMIFMEPEASDPKYHCLYLQSDIKAPARLVCENLLDVVHISYVHSFGNKENPLPLNDPIAFMKKDVPNHFAIHYFYKSGKKSFVKRFFQMADLHIENEFVLPHTVISRVRFGESVKTIVTFSLPKTANETTLFMKVYRNFMFYPNGGLFSVMYNYVMNIIVLRVVRETVQEDVKMLEGLNAEKRNGKYNVKYDRFPNMYRKMYDKNEKN